MHPGGKRNGLGKQLPTPYHGDFCGCSVTPVLDFKMCLFLWAPKADISLSAAGSSNSLAFHRLNSLSQQPHIPPWTRAPWSRAMHITIQGFCCSLCKECLISLGLLKFHWLIPQGPASNLSSSGSPLGIPLSGTHLCPSAIQQHIACISASLRCAFTPPSLRVYLVCLLLEYKIFYSFCIMLQNLVWPKK